MKQFKKKTGSRGIEWTDRTGGPIGGCLHDCKWEMPDGGVAQCYAKGIAEGVARRAYAEGFEPHYWRGDAGLKKLKSGRDPQLIFCDSMSDLFGHWVPQEQITAVLQAMGEASHHTYQSLTKAPMQILKHLYGLPPNLWVGVSSPPTFMMGRELSERQQGRFLARTLDVLRKVKAISGNICWMSLEPVAFDIAAYLNSEHPLDWVVIGAASNGRKLFMPDVGHIERLLTLFDRTNTPVFFKGNLRPLVEQQGWRWREDFPFFSAGVPIPAVIRRQENAVKYGWPLNEFAPIPFFE